MEEGAMMSPRFFSLHRVVMIDKKEIEAFVEEGLT